MSAKNNWALLSRVGIPRIGDMRTMSFGCRMREYKIYSDKNIALIELYTF